jgi:hypothetical protein
MVASVAAVTLAIVVQNQSALRASPRDSAVQQATLWQGDLLEVRGRSIDYLQVYDHRRERAGYVRARDVHPTTLGPEEAPELLAVIRFVRDTPGMEALGIGLTAAYFKAVPASALTVEPFVAFGEFADRLAVRASQKQPSRLAETTIAAQLEVVAQYGVRMVSYERAGHITICYDGDMFRRVLGLAGATPDAVARAALGLTRHACVDPALAPGARYGFDRWRSEVLDQAMPEKLGGELRARVHARRAGVWAAIAFQQTRRGEAPQAAAERALRELAVVDPRELSDEDLHDYEEAGVRVGATRWAAAAAPSAKPAFGITTLAGAPGETCVLLVDPRHGPEAPLAKRCTYATVWSASARVNPAGNLVALAVQPLEGWRELWLFRRTASGWTVTPLPPATDSDGMGYLEFAGWVAGTDRMLAARETLVNGVFRKRFEVINAATLGTERQAGHPGLIGAFGRWQARDWREQSVALR